LIFSQNEEYTNKIHHKCNWLYTNTSSTLTVYEIKIKNQTSQRSTNGNKLENYIANMDSLGNHFEFPPLPALHIGSDDWNRHAGGQSRHSSAIITSKTATEIKKSTERERKAEGGRPIQ
jgi:hypothetical protein